MAALEKEDENPSIFGKNEKYRKAYTNLVEYATDRGIAPHLFHLINTYEIYIKPHGSPYGKKYNYIGIPNYKNNGAVLSAPYEKMGSKKDGENHPIIINYYAPKVYLFTSIWDYLAYLTMCGNAWERVMRENAFIVLNHASPTKKEISLLGLEKFSEINLCFRSNKSGNTATNNALKVFGNAKDLREKWEGFTSLNNYICGKIE